MISREEAINFLKAHSECEKKKVKGIWEECNDELCDNCDLCYAQGNWGEHIISIDKAISDMQKLDRIEHTKPIDLLKEFGSLSTEQFNKIAHWYSQSKKLEKIEQIIKGEE